MNSNFDDRNEHSIEKANKYRENESARRCDKFATLVLRSDRLVINNGEDYCDSESSDDDDEWICAITM